MRNVSDKRFRENQDTHFVFTNFFTPRKSCRLWDMWKNMVQSDRPHRAILYGACAVHAWRLRLQTHAQNTLFHGNSGYANVPRCHDYTHIACSVSGLQDTCRTMERAWQSLSLHCHILNLIYVIRPVHLLIDCLPKYWISFSNTNKCQGFWIRLAVLMNSTVVLFAICCRSCLSHPHFT